MRSPRRWNHFVLDLLQQIALEQRIKEDVNYQLARILGEQASASRTRDLSGHAHHSLIIPSNASNELGSK